MDNFKGSIKRAGIEYQNLHDWFVQITKEKKAIPFDVFNITTVFWQRFVAQWLNTFSLPCQHYAVLQSMYYDKKTLKNKPMIKKNHKKRDCHYTTSILKQWSLNDF